jgi:cytochrome c peroxidase
MKRLPTSFIITAVVLLVMLAACGTKAPAPPAGVTVDPAKLQVFEPLADAIPSESNPLTEDKVALGRMLYYEPRMSKDQQISCNSCHDLYGYGMDGQPTSKGHKGQLGDRNSPTVYNAAGHFVQFWDGRAADVEEQAKGPVMNPVEMGMPSERQVVVVLRSMPEYVKAFKKAFPEEEDPVTLDNAAKAIGAFERRLVTPSRWDKFLRGDSAALTREEKIGFNDFTEVGCQACHDGAYVGGSQYQLLGIAEQWPDTSDSGREKVTGSEDDRMVFKVPSLRNIAKTAPYFHNGKVETLEDAISRMGQYQLGRTFTQDEVMSIATFLSALTGDIPADYIEQPALPESTIRTPKAELD